jgi:hypothetical protein
MAPRTGDSGGLSFPESGGGRLARRLCIVARDHPLLFGYLTTLLRDRPAGAEQIDLVIDRRHGPASKAAEVERRRPSNIDEQLRQRGFAFVAEPGETFRPRDAARIEHTVELLAGMEDRSWPFRRRRPRPLLERVWGQRPWRTLAVLGAVALISTMLAAEFRMNDLIEMDPGAPSRNRATLTKAAEETKAAKEAPPAPRSETAAESTRAEPRQVDATAATTPATSRLPAVSSADRQRVPGPAFSPPPEQRALAAAPSPPAAETPQVQTPRPSPPTQPPAAETPQVQTPRPSPPTQPPAAETPQVQTPRPSPPTRPPTAETPRVQASRPSLSARTASARPAPTSAPPAGAPELATASPTASAVPTSSDLRIELSRRPTSATGGGVVYLVRVTDPSGQPLPDAKVWMQAGRSASGALFETRLSPAEMPGTYRSGVVHPSTLPPDLTVRAIVGNRRVEAPVAR